MDEILNSNNLSNIRFRMAKPQGYYTEDVEKFIDVTLRESISAYQNELNNKDNTIADLEGTVSQLNSRIAELEIKDTFSSANSNFETDDALMSSITRIEELEGDVLALKSKLSSANVEATQKDEYIKSLNDHIDALTAMLDPNAVAEPTAANSDNEPEVYAEEVPAAVTNVTEPDEDLTSYESDDVIPQIANLTDDEYEEVEETFVATEPEPEMILEVEERIIDNNSIDFDSAPEVDIDMLNEELMRSGVEEEEDSDESETLPDGTVVPKGIRPEDL